jgi:hypothetical protein
MWNLPPPPGFQGLHPDKPVTIYVRHLPHWRQEGATYFVTFRLQDSLPQVKLDELEQWRLEWERQHGVGRFCKPSASQGRFAKPSGQEYFGVSTAPETIGTVDYDADGRTDVVIGVGGGLFEVHINDGNWPPRPRSLQIGDATVTEGNTGTIAAVFTVTLSEASTEAVTVAYATSNAGAIAGSDYQAASGTLTFAPGETSKTITVLVNGDRLAEPNEQFVVNLSSPTNATILDGLGVGTIVDDEPRISISDVTKSEGRKGKTTLFTFTVTLSAAYDQAVTMSFQTVNATATTSSGDYIAKTGTLTFAPGETTKTITIEVKGDSKKEGNETFYLDLFGNSANSLFTKNRGLGTILNDD